MKKFISVIIFILAMLITNYAYAQSHLYYNADGSSGISVVGTTAVSTATVGGESVFYTDTASGNKRIYFNVSEAVTYGNSNFKNVTVTVKFLDNGAVDGYFILDYDAKSSERKRHEQWGETRIANEVRTVVYELEDANFANRINGIADFYIEVAKMDSPLYFYEITVDIKGEISGIDITGASNSLGNIFFDNDTKQIEVTYDNLRTTGATLDVTYKILQELDKDNVLYQTTNSIALGEEVVTDTVVIPESIKKYGAYVLSVTATDETQNLRATEEIPFSLCVYTPASEINKKLGFTAHYEWGGRNPDATMQLIKKAGFSNTREEYAWTNFEKVIDGQRVYTPIEAFEESVAAADTQGINQILLVGQGNADVLNTIPEEVAAASAEGYTIDDRYLPITPEGRKAFVDYVLEILKRYEGKFGCVEVWNEVNLEGGCSNGYVPQTGVAHYINLLKDVYEAVNTQYPDVLIGSPVVSSLMEWESPWIDEFMAQNPHQYYDVFVFHNYSYTRRGGLDNIISQLNKYLSMIPEDKLIYISEFGVLSNSGDGLRTDISDRYEILDFQARGLSQYYLAMEAQNYCDKYYVYELVNASPLSDQWGVLNMNTAEYAYSAKPSFLTLAAANYLTAGSEGKGYELVDDTLRKLTFENKNKAAETYVYFTSDNSAKTVVIPKEGEVMEFYDMYANPINAAYADGEYSLNVSGEPVYAVVYYNKATVNVTREGSVYTISGNAIAAAPNSYITMKMFARTGELVYVDMTTVDKNKDFLFELIPMMESDLYTIHFGNVAFDGFFAMEAETLKTSGIYVAAIGDGEKILTIDKFNNAENLSITANINNSLFENSFKVIIACYKDNAMVSSKVIDKADMVFDENSYNLTYTDRPQEVDEIKLFLLNSTSEITPICENAFIN